MVCKDAGFNVVWADDVLPKPIGLGLKDSIGRKYYEVWHGRSIPCMIFLVQEEIKTGDKRGKIASSEGSNICSAAKIIVVAEVV